MFILQSMARLIFGAALLGAAHTSLAYAETAPAAHRLHVDTFTLANGLDVVVIPDHRAPVVTHMVWYRAGAADELLGESGIAHFLEHLMFKGTRAHPAGEFSNVIAELGGEENAFTSYDYTAYFQRVAKEHLRTMMEFEADRMTGLLLSDDVIVPERNVVLEERRQRTDNNPDARLGEQMMAALYSRHPYGIPIIGWEKEITELDRSHAMAFYERFYTPNNAILVVAGDVTADEVRQLAEETYGKIERRIETGPRLREREPEPEAARRVTLSDPRVQQPSLSRYYTAPSYTTADGLQAHALDLLSVILGDGGTSRLHRALVVEQGLAAAAQTYYSGDALDGGRFIIYAVPRRDVSLETLEAALDAELERVVREGVTADELTRARTRLIAEAIYAQDSQSQLARVFGATLTTGGTIDTVLNWPDRIQEVTREDVQAAAADVLQLRRSVTGLLLTAEPEPAQ